MWIWQALRLGLILSSYKALQYRKTNCRIILPLILKLLKTQRKEWLLNQLAFYKKKYKSESAYQVWQEGFHPELIQSDDMLVQKIEYIHYNLVKRGYVDEAEHWRYSSARNFMLNDHSVIGLASLSVWTLKAQLFVQGRSQNTIWERDVKPTFFERVGFWLRFITRIALPGILLHLILFAVLPDCGRNINEPEAVTPPRLSHTVPTVG